MVLGISEPSALGVTYKKSTTKKKKKQSRFVASDLVRTTATKTITTKVKVTK